MKTINKIGLDIKTLGESITECCYRFNIGKYQDKEFYENIEFYENLIALEVADILDIEGLDEWFDDETKYLSSSLIMEDFSKVKHPVKKLGYGLKMTINIEKREYIIEVVELKENMKTKVENEKTLFKQVFNIRDGEKN